MRAFVGAGYREGGSRPAARYAQECRIDGDEAGDIQGDAAAVATARIAAVRDDPAGRLALARSIYEEPTGRRSQRQRFRRAALAFTHWMAERGVLNALDSKRPGSRWWRAMNDRLLRDSCEAFLRATGRRGSPSTNTVDHWIAFIEQPTAQTWYRAHNASIVAAYLDHRDLAAHENRTERFFLNVVLARVLYAHALVAAPRLALGRIAPCGPTLGDPRRGTVDVFLAMGRVLPDDYPADAELEEYLQLEHKLGRVLDYAVIQPRLRPLYDWSARELERPELSDLLNDGAPAYAWPPDDLVSQLDTLSPGEERLAAVIRAAPVAVLEVDLDTRVVPWNTAAERIFGWREEDVLGEHVPFVPADREAEFQWLLGRVRAGNAYTGFETVRQRRDGTRVEVEIAAAPVRDESGAITSHMVVFTDISERVRHELELRASRAKMIEVGDAERRRLERNLHDGAQQRLVALSLELGRLERRFEDDPEARQAIDQARHELNESLQELRDLARGIHPAIVTAHGLAVAVESLAGRSPVPVELVVDLDDRVSETCQVAAYYVVSESLTNVAKYAHAATATIEIRSSDTNLVVEVRDDGGGGADATAGSGLRGLADRMEAVGGRLQVWSPTGGGTRIRAEIPIA